MKYLLFAAILSFASGLTFAQLTFTTSISASSDDAEEKFDGSYTTATSSDLELVYDSWNSQGLQQVGLRFAQVNIPSNAVITNAYIRFTADGSSSGNVNLIIRGENAANSQTFIHGSSPGNSVSSRNTTTANATWAITSNWSNNQSGAAQTTPNLSSVVSEIIQNNGWNYGNPLTFILTGDGENGVLRRAYSYDGNSTNAPVLTIEYESSDPIDLAVNNLISPVGSVIYQNASVPISVSISNIGTDDVSNYNVLCYINGVLHETVNGTVNLTSNQSLTIDFPTNVNFGTTGTYNLLIELDVPGDNNLGNNQLLQTIQVIESDDNLFFVSNTDWKYWANNVNPGNDWATMNFNDDAWSVGFGKMGFGQTNINEILPSGLARYCFRKKVMIDDIDAIENIYFHLMHDDGAVIYINGQEVFRTELMPLTNLTHSTVARQRINHDLANQYITYTIDKSYFNTGLNQIAIAVHNVSLGDGDLTFQCFSTPNFEYSQDGPYIFYEGNDIIVTEITPSGLVSNTYSSIEGMEFTCLMPLWDNKSFTFTVKPELVIEPSIFPATPPKFLVISDFDNHIEAFSMVLLGEGIMDDDFNWTYGDGHLIITGDLFDRGVNVTECLWLLYKLESEAAAQGGRVHLVIGNHEMMNIEDDWRYIEGKYFTNAQLMEKRMLDFYADNTEIGRWLRTKNIILKLGDYALMHGGISPQVANLNLTYQQMNDFGRARMNGQSCTGSCATVTGSNGVYWYRGMADEELTQQQVDDIVDAFDVKRVIFGHTKGPTVRSLYNGKVLAIDMYHMTNFANGFMEALQFELGCFRIFNTNGTNTTYTQLGACDDFVGIDAFKESGFLIYPNPSDQVIKVMLPDSMSGEAKYQILNSSGQIIASGNFQSGVENAIDVTFFAAGMYSIIIEDVQQTIAGKFTLK